MFFWITEERDSANGHFVEAIDSQEAVEAVVKATEGSNRRFVTPFTPTGNGFYRTAEHVRKNEQE